MAAMTQCDRCGKLIDSSSLDIKSWKLVEVSPIDSGGRPANSPRKELCASCAYELDKWMTEGHVEVAPWSAVWLDNINMIARGTQEFMDDYEAQGHTAAKRISGETAALIVEQRSMIVERMRKNWQARKQAGRE